MKISSIPFTSIQSIPKLIKSFLSEGGEMKFLYGLFPTPDNFFQQIKLKVFPLEKRKILSDVLIKQYKDCNPEESVIKNINRLTELNTYTVTTGHQVNLCTGPLFVIYKIIDTIKLSQVLNQKYMDYHFVPVFWLNSEDHDLEEINHIYVNGEKFTWNTDQTGSTGRMNTETILKTLESFKQKIKNSNHSEFDKELDDLFNLFYFHYTSSENLSNAILKIINQLFGKYGLVVVEPDNKVLKKIFSPVLKDELFNQNIYQYVTQQNEKLSVFDKPVVNPREINLFYIENGKRERIVMDKENSFKTWKVLNTDIAFTGEQLLNLLENSPEKFSPNVLLRCLYQQCILPNLGYIGGNVEISYWLQLKSVFDFYKESFPILLPRNSFFILNEKVTTLCEKLKINFIQLFDGIEKAKNEIIKRMDQNHNLIVNEKNQILDLLDQIAGKLKMIDPELIKSLEGEKIKIKKSLEHLEEKIGKVNRRKHENTLNQINKIYNSLFPDGKWQERRENILFLYSIFGDGIIDDMVKVVNPFDVNVIFLSK